MYIILREKCIYFQHSSPHKEPVIRISPLMNPSRYIVVSKVSNCCLLQRANTYFSANKNIKGKNCQFLSILIQSLIFSSTDAQCILVFTFKYWCNGTNVLLIFIIFMSQCICYDWSIWWDTFTVQPAKFKSLFWLQDGNLEIW